MTVARSMDDERKPSMGIEEFSEEEWQEVFDELRLPVARGPTNFADSLDSDPSSPAKAPLNRAARAERARNMLPQMWFERRAPWHQLEV